MITLADIFPREWKTEKYRELIEKGKALEAGAEKFCDTVLGNEEAYTRAIGMLSFFGGASFILSTIRNTKDDPLALLAVLESLTSEHSIIQAQIKAYLEKKAKGAGDAQTD